MPNHVTTICTVAGPEDDVARFVAEHLPAFDFDAIIPRPQSIRETTASSDADLGLAALRGVHKRENAILGPVPTLDAFLVGYGMVPANVRTQASLLAWLQRERPIALVEGERAARALDETGYADWYQWCRVHWGTKWSAYDVDVRERAPGRQVFKFETAWDFPRPIFSALTQRFPALAFDVISYDEGGFFAIDGGYGPGRAGARRVPCTPELYGAVYGRPPDCDEEG